MSETACPSAATAGWYFPYKGFYKETGSSSKDTLVLG